MLRIASIRESRDFEYQNPSIATRPFAQTSS
jgi:hypothetical protein